jgi:hypothetical protein
MPLTEDQDMIQAVAPECPDQARIPMLRMRVRKTCP